MGFMSMGINKKLKGNCMKNKNIQSNNNHWKTPDWFYDKLDKEFHFDFDPCPLNHDLSKWNGLNIDWGYRNFINSPYSRNDKEAFIIKAIHEARKGKLCVMLLPVSTSTGIFHNYIVPNAKEIRFIKGRLKFEGVNTRGEYVTEKTGQNDSMIVIFRGKGKGKPKLKFM